MSRPPDGERRISILLVGTDPAGQGGIATVAGHYVERASDPDVEVRLVVTHGSGGAPRKLMLAADGLARCGFRLARREPDLVHVLVSSGASFWRKLLVGGLVRCFRVPLVVHVHGGKLAEYVGSGTRVRARLGRRLLDGADLVVVLGEEMRADVLEIAPAARVRILPNAVALPDRAIAYTTGGATRVVTVGKIGPRKGTPELIGAFGAMRAPGARLVLAGNGDRQGARRLAHDLGLGDRVELPGWLDPASRDELLAGATIFALPSHSEGLPMALLEAMAHGLPSVATPVGAVSELVEDRVNGLLVPVGDEEALRAALQELADSVALRERLGRAARETVRERFAIERVTGDLRHLWRSVIDEAA